MQESDMFETVTETDLVAHQNNKGQRDRTAGFEEILSLVEYSSTDDMRLEGETARGISWTLDDGARDLSTTKDASLTSTKESVLSVTRGRVTTTAQAPRPTIGRKRGVTFGLNRTHMISSIRGKKNLWWTMSELEQARRKDKSDFSEQDAADDYALHFKESYLHFFHETSDILATEGLAKGLQRGCQGFERFSDFEVDRSKHREQIVQCVLEAYHSEKIATLRHDAAQTVYASLSTKLVQWAAYIGHAAHTAAVDTHSTYSRHPATFSFIKSERVEL
jgi:hypothetical protein